MTIEILDESGSGIDVRHFSALSRFVMDRMRVHPLAELCVKAVDEDTIAELNEKWMEKEGPTDVLAFPMDELRPGKVNEDPEEGVLGDLILCPSVAERQGRRPDTARSPSWSCSPCTASCTSSATTTPSRRSTRRCSASRTSCSPSGDRSRATEPPMSSGDIWQLVTAALLVVLAGLFTAADAAIASFSRARALELAQEGRAGARRLVAVLDDAPRHLNTALLLELLSEVSAIVLVTLFVSEEVDGWWQSLAVAIGVMLVVSFVAIGVAPRTLGRQHPETVALASAWPLSALTSVLGPIPRLLIAVGNAITPGKGFREGPFSSETELREMVDIAEASELIEAEERRMIHSVFELGDTTVREVMVPRGDVVFIEHYKNLRQTLSLFLRSGFSRIPVIGENLDDIRGFVYLKDVVRRDFEQPEVETVLRVEEIMRPVHWVPESKPVDALLREMQARRQHVAAVVDEYGGTAGLITIEDLLEEIVGEITDEYDAAEIEVEELATDVYRVSSRYPVDDLDELFGADIEEEDVDSVGGLMAKHLGRVPIPGSVVEAHGLRFEAEQTSGRRNQIGTLLISRTETDETEDE